MRPNWTVNIYMGGAPTPPSATKSLFHHPVAAAFLSGQVVVWLLSHIHLAHLL